MSGENDGKLRKVGERLKRRSPSVNKVLFAFSRGCASGSKEFSRLPDSATLAPLRLVELSPCQGRVGAELSSLQSAPGELTAGSVIFQSLFFSLEEPVRWAIQRGLVYQAAEKTIVAQ